MLASLEEGVKASNSLVTLIEKIATRVLGIGDRKRKKAELARLIRLLNETRITRTLNQGLTGYLREAIEDYKKNPNHKEIATAVSQIEKSIASILEIIDTMSDEGDKVAIYQNTAWNELHTVLNGRLRLLDELRTCLKSGLFVV